MVVIVIAGAAVYSYITNKGKKKKVTKRNSFGEVASHQDGGEMSPIVSRNPLQRDSQERSQRSMRAATAGGGSTGRASFAPQAVDVGDNYSVPRTEWMSCTDLAKGVTYYVNMQTKESVWTLPEGGVIVKRMSQ